MTSIVAIDSSHILYREFFRQVGNKPASRITDKDMEIAKKKAIKKLQRLRRKHKPDKFVVAFDDKTSWRTQFTREADMRLYKSGRKKSVRDARIQKKFNTFRMDIKQTITKKQKKMIVVAGKKLEADDLLAGIGRLKKKKDTLKVYTSDKDMRQMMLRKNVSVLDIKTGKEMSRERIREDLFERMIRGRHSYNVVSVFKRLSSENLQRAYEDPDYLAELFKEEDANPDTRIGARKRFFKNRRLFNMDFAPRIIKKLIRKTLKKKVFP